MISILIPVYNYDIASLVTGLQHAVKEIKQYDEIIIGADGCTDDFLGMYGALSKLDKVKLLVSEKNIGRAAIRNLLAASAVGDYLLFIDADALIQGNPKDYLTRWLDNYRQAPVVCGGTDYHSTAPDNPDKYLRWHFGYYNEKKSVKKRRKKPYSTFSGFNFLIEKSILDRFKFNEELRKYGHEDTLFAYQLKKAGIDIAHIDNSLIHDGLESNREYILKTKDSISNLNILYDKVTDKRTFASVVKLLRYYKRLSFFGITRLLAYVYRRRQRRIEIMLRSTKCSLRIFKIYKLGLFCYYRYNMDENEG
ncbi:MAG: glycosyltransferase family 2 protein [Bacteroidales bacterium]